jgi:hypothetical protein
MPEGVIHLTKISAGPDLYSVTFETDDAPRTGQAARTFARTGELDEFLQQAGIPSDRIKAAIRDVSEGSATIAPVTLTDGELLDLGLTKSSGTAEEPS